MMSRLVVGIATALLLFAGCGEDASDTGSEEAPDAAPALPEDQPWLVRFEIGTDEVASGVSYVRVTPTTGATQVTNLRLDPADYEPNEYLQVDADRLWALRANAATIQQEDDGEVTIYSLTGKPKRVVDLRKATGVGDLKPLGFAFDPETPGLLRVLATDGRLFEYDVASGTTTPAGTVETRPGFELAPQFDSATGEPLLRNSQSYEYEHGSPYRAGGISPVSSESGACPDPAAAHSSIEDSSGMTWDACLDGRQVKIFRRGAGDGGWQLVGTSAPKVPTDTMTMTWVLPPLG